MFCSTLSPITLLMYIYAITTSNGEYTITCTEASPCSSSIMCPANQHCNISCTARACNNIQIVCPNSLHACTVTCLGGSGARSCNNIVIIATNSLSLNIEASGIQDTMAASNIYCPINGNCNITCSFSRACYRATVYTADRTILDVNITGSYTFESGIIYCSTNADCTLMCNGIYSCFNVVINSNRSAQISLSTFAQASFENGKLYGSYGEIIRVKCEGQNSCNYALFDALHSSELTIDGSNGYGMLQGASIYCPDNGIDKSIACNISVSGSDPLLNAVIYAAEAFRDVYIYCEDINGDICDINLLKMKCTDSYISECYLVALSHDTFSCESASLCTTFEYTSYPTLSSYEPTNIPTMDPFTTSTFNTLSLTKERSTNSSIFPTSNPITSDTISSIPTQSSFISREVQTVYVTTEQSSVTKTVATKDDSFAIVAFIASLIVCCAISGVVFYVRHESERDAKNMNAIKNMNPIENMNVQQNNSQNQRHDASYVDMQAPKKQNMDDCDEPGSFPKKLKDNRSNPLKMMQDELRKMDPFKIKSTELSEYQLRVRNCSHVTDEYAADKEGYDEYCSTEGALGNDEIIYDDENAEHRKAKQWLQETCECQQYLDEFITNGYESTAVIKEIEDKSELEEIGIKIRGDRTKIWAEIEKLKLSNKHRVHSTIK